MIDLCYRLYKRGNEDERNKYSLWKNLVNLI